MSGIIRENTSSYLNFYGNLFSDPWKMVKERKHKSARIAASPVAALANVVAFAASPVLLVHGIYCVAIESIMDRKIKKDLNHEDRWCIKRSR